eukprot:TRINITY_DN8825_c0_g1_i1.p1 TRINITY_DN8825_c0_g1~~TRINITY_DN8825_c0_g1_i1.p1  ORF type:complete len:276 (-),score=50.05 TRINITY_DN8825_c0_g1_i1:369-1196(-)
MSSDKPSVLQHAANRAFQGGTSGAMAMGIQVSTLMWMRTTMNYQYRYGMTTSSAMKALYASGGIRRFYRGFLPALFQGPLSRFGDTAANVGVLTLLEPYDIPVFLKTGAASVTAGLWRIAIMPIDTLKTTLQVEGVHALPQLKDKIKVRGPFVMFHGALAAASATMAGHFPWFFTFNYLQETLPKPEHTYQKLGRNAFIGFVSSVVSDSVSNSLRVIKTTRQTFPSVISYTDVVKHIVDKDGVMGLLGRGLKTRILTNGIQGLMFSVLWKYFMDR